MTITGQEKAAVLLASLAPELRREVLERLGALGAQLRERLRALEERPPDEAVVRAVKGEFELALHRSEPPPTPHWHTFTAATRARHAYGAAPRGTERAAHSSEEADDLAALIRSIQAVDPQELVRVLSAENPGAIALVLQLLDPACAARVIAALPASLAAAVSERLVRRRTVPEALLRQILRAVVQRLHVVRVASGELGDERLRWLAQAVRGMRPPARVKLLTTLDEQNPDLARALRQLVYRVDDLVSIPDPILRRVIQKLDARSLAAVLSGADALVRSKVLRVLPPRVKTVVAEALEGETFAAEVVSEATSKLIETICDFELRGQGVLSAA